jgi:methionine--tRNA ligase beta chain
LLGITHSLCTLEFADHRPLYDWTIEKVMPSGILPYKKENWRPKQIEFSRLNLEYTVLSKRKLIQLVSGGYVDGWDDPRMPTISAIRRRGYPYKAIQLFCDRIGISRAEGTIDITIFEETIRDYLDAEAPRIFAVMDPLKITITNWDKDLNQIILAENHPKKSNYGNREVTFSKTLYIDRSDFFDSGLNGDKLPPKGFKRLLINNTVRLKYGYVITCNEVIRDSLTNEAKELLCTYDPNTSNGQDSVNIKKPKGIIQWVSELNSVPVHLNIYDRLFSAPFPGKDKLDGDFLKDINPDSKHVITTGFIEKSISDWKYGTVFQFERLGYFYLDPISNQKQINDPVVVDKPLVFNRVVTLKDTWQQLIDNNDKKEPKVENKPSSNVIEGLSASVDTYGDFNKLDMRVGKVLEVQKHPEAENLYIQKVDCGESTGPRIIVSGLVRHFTPEQLLQQSVIVLCNLKPSKLRGVVSDGMILAAVKADDENGSNAKEIVELISPPANTNPGEKLFISESNKVLMDRSTISKDVWVRIAPKMKINPRKELCFGSDDIVIKTNYGVCVTSSISNAIVR